MVASAACRVFRDGLGLSADSAKEPAASPLKCPIHGPGLVLRALLFRHFRPIRPHDPCLR
jgi:hypothetical protein